MQRFDDPAREIRVRVGEAFGIELESNPTTGYRWELGPLPEPLRLLEREFRTAGTGIGAGGRDLFVLQAQRAGRGEVAFAYRRPWEPTPHHAVQFRVVIAGEAPGAPG